MSHIDTVIVLGAGASAAEGAPVQSTLFRDYFKLQRSRTGYSHDWDRELATFFLTFFGIDVDSGDLDRVVFPTFEETLGILEIAESQDESFRDWLGPHLIHDGTSRIKHIHDLLVFSIGEILQENLGRPKGLHHTLLERLQQDGALLQTAFASFNYDILMDNALLDRFGTDAIDYAVGFVNQPRPGRGGILLSKLHGSLNWLYCSTCRDLEITPHEKGIVRLKWEPEKTVCRTCGTPRSPIVVPPTFFKVMSNLYLRMIWDTTERACTRARRIIFCGYSLPDADIHVRYLLKRAEINRGATPEVFIVNNHHGKEPPLIEQEFHRYRRFFVQKQCIHYTKLSFEEFANDPTVVEDRSTWL